MTKQELLHELQHETFIALQASGIHGIGVFAICDIAKGCKTLFSKNTGSWIELSFAEVEQLPAHSRNFVKPIIYMITKNILSRITVAR